MAEGIKTEFLQKGPYNFVAVEKMVAPTEKMINEDNKKINEKKDLVISNMKRISTDGTYTNASKSDLLKVDFSKK